MNSSLPFLYKIEFRHNFPFSPYCNPANKESLPTFVMRFHSLETAIFDVKRSYEYILRKARQSNSKIIDIESISPDGQEFYVEIRDSVDGSVYRTHVCIKDY